MPDLQGKVELAVSDNQADAINLYHIAQILQAQFPDRSITELAWRVAELAIQKGARYLIWDPPDMSGL